MPSVNPKLLARLVATTGLSDSRVYRLIGRKVRETNLTRPLAAIALAGDYGINISRYATADDLAEIRNAVRTSPAPVPETRAPSAGEQTRRLTPARATRPARRTATVFVVHGRNDALREDMYSLLRALGLRPREWVQAIRQTGQPSPNIGDILDAAFRDAVIVVLMTPDDVARLKPDFRKRSDPQYEGRLTGQPRANVLFEAGMAFGRKPERTVLVEVGTLRPFSDLGGKHAVRLSNRAESRQELATKLRNAGCAVDTTGADWLTIGDFRVRSR